MGAHFKLKAPKYLGTYLACVFITVLSGAEVLAKQTHVVAEISPWRSQCDISKKGEDPVCTLPVGLGAPPISLDFFVESDLNPNEATRESKTFEIPLSENSKMYGSVALYSVYPSPPVPRYIQVRADLFGPVWATCAESVRLKDPVELPPIICAGMNENAGTQATRFGVTLVFKVK